MAAVGWGREQEGTQEASGRSSGVQEVPCVWEAQWGCRRSSPRGELACGDHPVVEMLEQPELQGSVVTTAGLLLPQLLSE